MDSEAGFLFLGKKCHFMTNKKNLGKRVKNLNQDMYNTQEHNKGLGAIRAKIGPTSDVDKIFSKMYSQYIQK